MDWEVTVLSRCKRGNSPSCEVLSGTLAMRFIHSHSNCSGPEINAHWRARVCSPVFNYCVIFGVLTAVSAKIAVCRNVTPCNLVHRYCRNHQIPECLNLSVHFLLQSFYRYHVFYASQCYVYLCSNCTLFAGVCWRFVSIDSVPNECWSN